MDEIRGALIKENVGLSGEFIVAVPKQQLNRDTVKGWQQEAGSSQLPAIMPEGQMCIRFLLYDDYKALMAEIINNFL